MAYPSTSGNEPVHTTRAVISLCAHERSSGPRSADFALNAHAASCNKRRTWQRAGGLLSQLMGLAAMLAAILPSASQATVLIKLPPPTVAKWFDPSYVYVGGTTQMTIELTNSNTTALTGVQFTDAYPLGLVNAANAPGGVIAINTCGGTVTADAGGTSAALIGGTIPPATLQYPVSCKIVLNVSGTAAGTGNLITNHTGPVTVANAFAGADATADLTVANAPLLQAPIATITAMPGSIDVGGNATIMIALSNPNVTPIEGTQLAINY